jgi:hypothetical protein
LNSPNGRQAGPLSTTTDFIFELVRAANEIGKLTPFEKRRLLELAVKTIREGRDQVGAAPGRTEPDRVIDLETVAASIASAPDVLVGHAMLEAADMIRTLKKSDAKEEVTRGE